MINDKPRDVNGTRRCGPMKRRSIILFAKCSVWFKMDSNSKGVPYPQNLQALGPRKVETEGEIIDLQVLYLDLL